MFTPCPSCQRHVRSDAAVCRFCGAERRRHRSLGPGLVLALATLAGGCDSSTPIAPAYGGPPPELDSRAHPTAEPADTAPSATAPSTTASAATAPTATTTGDADDKPIGSATMKEDGTIVLMLRAEGPGGMVGDAMQTYPKGHEEYDEVLKHLGGLKPGESKPVPPWPDE